MVRAVLVVVFAGICVGATSLMPWAELGMPKPEDELPHTIKLLQMEAQAGSMIQKFDPLRNDHVNHLSKKNAEGPMGDYVYALMMAAALAAGAVAIMAIGSEDEVEKTIIPAKK